MDQVIQSTGGKIDVVYTSADVMALGAIAALEAAKVGKDGVVVTGMDGNKATPGSPTTASASSSTRSRLSPSAARS